MKKRVLLPANKPPKNKKPNFVLTSRDIRILEALNLYRYLQTGQVWRLVFPENNTPQSTRRRLKILYLHKYVNRIIPYVQLGKQSPETAYFLGNKGVQTLRELGAEVRVWKKASRVKHLFLQHALDLSEFRISLEATLQELPNISLNNFIADYETKARTDAAMGSKRYKLYSTHLHKASRESYVVHPDALIDLEATINNKKYNALYFLEVDRGTESLSRIRDKIIGYNIYLEQNIYKKYGDFQGFKVLIQAHSKKRAHNIRKTLLDQKGSEMVWVTSADQVNSETILHGEIWLDSNNQPRKILNN